ncbi:MAG: tRNA epoxyqueuosine(34) reductase QueG [Burkholderiaceae bacterium]
MEAWARELGFEHVGVADVRGMDASPQLQAWLAAGCHGEMEYMAREPQRRARPAELVGGTLSAIMVGARYAPRPSDWRADGWRALAEPGRAYVSNYARGRDYHKRVRRRLARLAEQIAQAVGPFGHRAFCDSAPVMEVEIAARAGLGWRGKHTLLLNREQGSMFFLGTLYTDLPLRADLAAENHCGRCRRCLDVCPTRAFDGPYRLDARRCISYLTIEHRGPIPESLRAAIGNRVYGCDDCQLVCPWNKFARPPVHDEFDPRHGLDAARLLSLWAWGENDFDARLQGSAIRRIGWSRWRRNLAVAIGNLAQSGASACLLAQARVRLADARASADPLVAEHIDWALARLAPRADDDGPAARSVVRS